MRRRRLGYLLSGIAAFLLLAGAVGIFTSTVTIRQGVNFQISTRNISFYVKTLGFLHRHSEYEALAKEIVGDSSSDRERVLAVFDWTRRNIRRTPKEWPVVDDHILHIIIRGHGLDDQIADVFTTLSTYAGVPAFSQILELLGSEEKLVLSFARVEGKWVVFDVANGLVFKNARGDLASAAEIAADPGLVTATAGALRLGGIPYVQYFSNFTSPPIPRPLRAELQMPWPRFWHEAQQIVR